MADIEELRKIVATFTPEQRLAFESSLKANGVVLPDLSDPAPASPLAGVGRAALSTLGKIGDVLDTGENLVMSGLRPVLESAIPAAKKVYAEKGGNVVPSDILDASMPNLPGPAKFIAGLGLDIAFDPLTYIGIGPTTKTGKALEAAQSLTKAGVVIKPTSELAKDIAKMSGKTRATKKMIEDAAVQFAPSFSEQARMGQRALISVGNPFTGSRDFTLVKGAAIFGRLEQLTGALKGTAAAKKIRDIFSTSTGNKEFDAFRDELVSLGRDRLILAKEDAATYAKKVEVFANKFGLSKNDVEEAVTSLAENRFYGDKTAAEVIKENADILHRSLTVDRAPIERTIHSLPDFRNLPMEQRAKLLRDVTDEIAKDHAGYNVYTTALTQLPGDMRREFAQTFSDMAKLKIGTGFGKNNRLKTAKVGEIYTKFHDSGEDAALEALLGKKEYLRLIKEHETLLRTNTQLRTPNFFINNPVTEYAQAQHNLRELVSHTNQMFGTTYNIWKANPKYVEQSMPKVAALLKRVESNPSWKVQALVDQFRIPVRYARKHPELFDLAQQVRRWGQEQLQREWAVNRQIIDGVHVDTGQFIGDIGYVAHVPSKAVREWLQKNGGSGWEGAAREWTSHHQSQFVRKLRSIDEGKVNAARTAGLINDRQVRALLNRTSGKNLNYLDRLVEDGFISEDVARGLVHTLTVDEVNALSKDGKLRILGNQRFDKFFETNPAEIIRVRGARGARAITGAEFLEGSKKFGVQVAPGTMPPPGFSMAKAPELAGYAFEHDVAKHIDKYYESIKFPTAAHPFLQAYDSAQDVWKAWTLSLFPSYHLRNLIGNTYNNFLAGMGPESVGFYKDALQIQRGKKFTLETVAGQKYNREQIIHMARRYGIVDTGQFHGDIEKYFEIEAKGLGKLTRNKVITSGLKVSSYVENNAKLAHFMWQLKQGMSPVDASQSVKKYLFDYRNLSDTEKHLFRRVLPFYTWTRNNVPLQLQSLITRPGKTGGVFKLRNALETDQDGKPDERLLPDWMVQNYPIRIRKNNQTENYEYFLMGSWLPVTDIDKIFDPMKTLGSMLGPFIKEPAQQAANKDFFTGREIDSGDEYVPFLGKSRPARAVHLAKNARVLNEADKLFFNEDSDVTGRVLNFFTSKLQPLNEEGARKGKKYEFDKKERNIKRLINRARNRGDDEEEARLQTRLEALKEKKSAVLQ